jgi:hypothetical protein
MITSPGGLVAVTSALVLDVAARPGPASPAHGAAWRLRPYAQYVRPMDLQLGAPGPAGAAGRIAAPAGNGCARSDANAPRPAGDGAGGADGAVAAGAGRDGGQDAVGIDPARGADAVSSGGPLAGMLRASSAGDAAAAVAGAGVGVVEYSESGGVPAMAEVECLVRQRRVLEEGGVTPPYAPAGHGAGAVRFGGCDARLGLGFRLGLGPKP